MKAIKFIGQVLASLVYTPLYTGIMYVAIVLPAAWILSLSFWKMVVAFIVFGGFIEGLIHVLQMIGLLPFAWIVKNNKFAFGLSALLCILGPLWNIVQIWRFFPEYGTAGFVASFIFTLMIVQFVFGSIVTLTGLNKES